MCTKFPVQNPSFMQLFKIYTVSGEKLRNMRGNVSILHQLLKRNSMFAEIVRMKHAEQQITEWLPVSDGQCQLVSERWPSARTEERFWSARCAYVPSVGDSGRLWEEQRRAAVGLVHLHSKQHVHVTTTISVYKISTWLKNNTCHFNKLPLYILHYVIYTVSHKKCGTLFLIVTLAFIGWFLYFLFRTRTKTRTCKLVLKDKDFPRGQQYWNTHVLQTLQLKHYKITLSIRAKSITGKGN